MCEVTIDRENIYKSCYINKLTTQYYNYQDHRNTYYIHICGYFFGKNIDNATLYEKWPFSSPESFEWTKNLFTKCVELNNSIYFARVSKYSIPFLLMDYSDIYIIYTNGSSFIVTIFFNSTLLRNLQVLSLYTLAIDGYIRIIYRTA